MRPLRCGSGNGATRDRGGGAETSRGDCVDVRRGDGVEASNENNGVTPRRVTPDERPCPASAPCSAWRNRGCRPPCWAAVSHTSPDEIICLGCSRERHARHRHHSNERLTFSSPCAGNTCPVHWSRPWHGGPSVRRWPRGALGGTTLRARTTACPAPLWTTPHRTCRVYAKSSTHVSSTQPRPTQSFSFPLVPTSSPPPPPLLLLLILLYFNTIDRRNLELRSHYYYYHYNRNNIKKYLKEKKDRSFLRCVSQEMQTSENRFFFFL